MSSQKRKNVNDITETKIPRLQSPAKSQPLAAVVQNEMASFISKTDLDEAISNALCNFLPQITESIQQLLETKLQQFTQSLIEQVKHAAEKVSSPVPPPPSSSQIQTSTSFDARTNLQMVKDKLRTVINERQRPFYQSLRHKGLIEILSKSVALDEPKIPRKFAERIGKFDQPEIINRKKAKTIYNVNNEVEILKIYADSDDAKVLKVDQKAEEVMAVLNDAEKNLARIFFNDLVTKEQCKSEKIWANKCKFLNSEKYLIDLNKLMSFEGRSHIYNKSHSNYSDNNNVNSGRQHNFNYNNNHRSNNNFLSQNAPNNCTSFTNQINKTQYQNNQRHYDTYAGALQSHSYNRFNSENNGFNSFRHIDQNFRTRQITRI